MHRTAHRRYGRIEAEPNRLVGANYPQHRPAVDEQVHLPCRVGPERRDVPGSRARDRDQVTAIGLCGAVILAFFMQREALWVGLGALALGVALSFVLVPRTTAEAGDSRGWRVHRSSAPTGASPPNHDERAICIMLSTGSSSAG
ncbi:MAG: hypothetical protein DWI59_05005 [Chloroflexi bacterium]|nr:MAG: hypothetical protein DWI59_05005 [Chloroflexota bacterium]